MTLHTLSLRVLGYFLFDVMTGEFMNGMAVQFASPCPPWIIEHTLLMK